MNDGPSPPLGPFHAGINREVGLVDAVGGGERKGSSTAACYPAPCRDTDRRYRRENRVVEKALVALLLSADISRAPVATLFGRGRRSG